MGKLSFFDEKKLMIGGHRGSAGVAPENTLVSFQRAFDDGADFVEMDLREGLEGEVLIIHDEDLERTTDGQGTVREWAFKHLKSLDAGHRFTLDGGISYPYRGQMITTSQAMRSALARTSSARRLISARLPIGVATR